MKRISASIGFSLSMLTCSVAHAQWAVIDVANVQQSIYQVDAWKKQYDQMLQQQQQLQAQQAAMTGSRGLGMIANDPRLRGIVPDTAAQIFSAIQANGGTSMTPAAQTLRAASRVYDCENLAGKSRATCQAFLNNTSQTQAFQQNAMTVLTQRITQIQSLQGQINATNDPKAIAELQARLQVETVQVNNDNNRLTIMKAMADSADRAAQQGLKEQELKNIALTSDGTDTFVYKPYIAK
jgi:type IV secretion system protein VirB5